MASMHWTLLAVLANVTLIISAPSDVNKLEDIAKTEKANAELETPLTLTEENNDNADTTQGQRQKRFYNYYGYGFPPMNPVIYPNRDDQYGQYGYEDPILQIQRRLQDIAGIARTSNYNAPPPFPFGGHFPILFPVIFIPYVNCACTPNQTPDNQTELPDVNSTNPDIFTRFPQMDVWTLNANETGNEQDDFTRPISFQPIPPKKPISRPPPSVEHGSSQAGIDGPNIQDSVMPPTTTFRPQSNPPRPMQNRPPSVPLEPPSACDGAILSCCHQPQVIYDCFALSGCPDPTSYGNPCEIDVILRVVNRFQAYYGNRG